MKLLKKLLAAVTVTALALTMLTACGSDGGKNTFTLVDYLNDIEKASDYNMETTFKADTTLDANAKAIADVFKSAGVKSTQDIYTKAENDETFAKKVISAAGVNEQTENKYFYQFGYTQVNQKWTTDTFKDNEVALQAMSILGSASENQLNAPEAIKKYEEDWDGQKVWRGDIDYTKLDGTTSVGTATVELGGKTYLIAVFRTAVKA